jgi:glycosyltransferase involved in cell wall biosynthesis
MMNTEGRDGTRDYSWFLEPRIAVPRIGSAITNAMYMVWLIRLDLRERFDLATQQGALDFFRWWLVDGHSYYKGVQFPSVHDLKTYLQEPEDSIEQDGLQPINRGQYLIWSSRDNLQAAFDLNTVEGREGLIAWWFTSFPSDVSASCAFEISDSTDAEHEEAAVRASDACPREGTQEERLGFGSYNSGGINIVGFAFGELGLGEDVRMAAAGMASQRVPFSVYNAPIRLQSGTSDLTVKAWLVEKPVYQANLVFLPAVETLRIFLVTGDGTFRGRYTIGAWQWELPTWPRQLRDVYRLVQEIWASTRYTAAAFRESSPVPVFHMPMAVHVPTVPPMSREEFGLPQGCFVFLFVFDSLSRYARKNPLGTIEAFSRAFPRSNRDVRLVIKCMHAMPQQRVWRDVMDQSLRDDRIVLINETFSRGRILGLFGCCDALLSLHRAEGFGRTIAEAMLLGKPVIVTNYSGNTDFTTKETAFLVDGPLVPLKPGDYFFSEDHHWCEPDLDQAAYHMRRCFEDSGLARRVAKSGQTFIQENHNPEVIGRSYRKRLEDLGIISGYQ